MRSETTLKSKIKIFLSGLIVGVLVAIPIGMNLGRDAPVFSNPFAEPEVRQQMGAKVKEGADEAVERTKEAAGKAVEGAKRTIHEATRPESNSIH